MPDSGAQPQDTRESQPGEFTRVLAPLDGSPLARVVIPYLAEYAAAFRVREVRLLGIKERNIPPDSGDLQQYLQHERERLEALWRGHGTDGSLVQCRVVRSPAGKAAEAILRVAEETVADLIVLSSHGRTGIVRWLLGSVAEDVIHGADVPVLLIRPAEHPPAEEAPRHLLVPLDGSVPGEASLPYVESLARTSRAGVTLLHIHAAGPQPGRPPQAQEDADIATYLGDIAAALRAAGIPVEVKTRAGDPGEQIVAEAQEAGDGLIVMASHGRTGLLQWAFGSVAEHVLRGSPIPVLLIRSPGLTSVPEALRGPRAYRCHNCGRKTYRRRFTAEDRCIRCHQHLKTCGNCVQFDGVGCILQLPYVSEPYPGIRCPQFEFRRTPLLVAQ